MIHDRKKGVRCIVIYAFMTVMMSACIRLVGPLPTFEKVFLRNGMLMILTLFTLIGKKTSFTLKRGDGIQLVGRGVLGTLGLLCNYYAIDHLLLADATMLNKLSPFFAVGCSAIFLHEKISLAQIVALFVALLGSLFIIKPSFSNTNLLASMIGFAGGFFSGCTFTIIRSLNARNVSPNITILSFSVLSTVISFPFMLGNYVPVTNKQLLFLGLASVTGIIGQFSLTHAYAHAPSSELGPYDYLQIVFAALMGILLYGERPDIYSIIGYAIIFVTVLFGNHYKENGNSAAE